MLSLVRQLLEGFRERGLLPWATAISYNALWTLPPLALFFLALAGEVGAESVWTKHAGPIVHGRVTEPTWRAIDATARQILDHPHVVWVALGAILGTWEMSGLVRSVGGALNAVFGLKETRTTWRRLAITTGVAFPVLLFAALPFFAVLGGSLVHGSGVVGVLLGIARWIIALASLFGLLALLLRVAPAAHPQVRWISAGAGLVVAGWVGASLVFGLYVRYLADFRSPYGNLISVMVLMSYVYCLSVVFVAGVLVDVLSERAVKSSSR